MISIYRSLCGKNVAKHPYGELGSVERGNFCCCVAADSAFGPISPGCGCDGAKVDDIVTVLKERMRARGDTAQIKRTEQTLEQLKQVDAKLVRSFVYMNCTRNEPTQLRRFAFHDLNAFLNKINFISIVESYHGTFEHSTT